LFIHIIMVTLNNDNPALITDSLQI